MKTLLGKKMRIVPPSRQHVINPAKFDLSDFLNITIDVNNQTWQFYVDKEYSKRYYFNARDINNLLLDYRIQLKKAFNMYSKKLPIFNANFKTGSELLKFDPNKNDIPEYVYIVLSSFEYEKMKKHFGTKFISKRNDNFVKHAKIIQTFYLPNECYMFEVKVQEFVVGNIMWLENNDFVRLNSKNDAYVNSKYSTTKYDSLLKFNLRMHKEYVKNLKLSTQAFSENEALNKIRKNYSLLYDNIVNQKNDIIKL